MFFKHLKKKYINKEFWKDIHEMYVLDYIYYPIYRFVKYKLYYEYFNWRWYQLGFKNLIYYFTVIWNDRDYDHSYLLAILEKKINKKLKFFENPDNIHIIEESRLEIVNDLKELSEILHRICNDAYDFHDKYNKLNKEFKSVIDFKPYEKDTEYCEMITSVHAEDKTKEEYDIEFDKIHKEYSLQQEIDNYRLGELMKQCRKWWD